MLLNDKIKFTDNEIVEKGSRALIKELGYSGFLRYISHIENSDEDYMKLQESIYKDMPLDELFENASEEWSKKNQ